MSEIHKKHETQDHGDIDLETALNFVQGTELEVKFKLYVDAIKNEGPHSKLGKFYRKCLAGLVRDVSRDYHNWLDSPMPTYSTQEEIEARMDILDRTENGAKLMVYRKGTIVAPFVDVFQKIVGSDGQEKYMFLYQIASDGEPNFDFGETWFTNRHGMLDGPTVGKVVAYDFNTESQLLEGRKFHEEDEQK